MKSYKTRIAFREHAYYSNKLMQSTLFAYLCRVNMPNDLDIMASTFLSRRESMLPC